MRWRSLGERESEGGTNKTQAHPSYANNPDTESIIYLFKKSSTKKKSCRRFEKSKRVVVRIRAVR